MAFPTSPSNNDVHKEGNRSFVYDSTLDTWDQVKETDRFSVESGGGVAHDLTRTGVSFPAGHILQVASAVSTSTSTSWGAGSTNTYFDTGVEATLTPSSSSNKIMVFAMCTIGHTANGEGTFRVQRNINSAGWTAPSVIADAVSNAERGQVGGWYDDVGTSETATVHASWLDSPGSTATCGYRIEIHRWDGTVYMNRPDTASTPERKSGCTSITIMEVAV